MKNYKVINNLESDSVFSNNKKGEINFACDEETLKQIYHEKISTEEGLKEWNEDDPTELIIEMEGVEEIKMKDFKYFITFTVNEEDENEHNYMVYSDFKRELEEVIETLEACDIGLDEYGESEDEDGNPYIPIYSSEQFIKKNKKHNKKKNTQ